MSSNRSSNDGGNNSQDASGSETFKQQLDRVATENRANDQSQQQNSIAEKITEYIPAAAKILGTSQPEETEEKPKDIPGPPERPDHDHKIEEFVRDQHRSKAADGSLVTGSSTE